MSDPSAYRVWKERLFGSDYMIWHDGLDTRGLSRLRGDERTHALSMLEVGVALGDPHAAEALAALGEPRALPQMRAQMALARGSTKVQLAIHRLQPDAALAQELVEVLSQSDGWTDQIDAAIGLRHFHDASSEQALLAAVCSAEYLVRYHACESLLSRFGVQPASVAQQRALFELIRVPNQGKPSGAQQRGYQQATKLLQRLRAAP